MNLTDELFSVNRHSIWAWYLSYEHCSLHCSSNYYHIYYFYLKFFSKFPVCVLFKPIKCSGFFFFQTFMRNFFQMACWRIGCVSTPLSVKHCNVLFFSWRKEYAFWFTNINSLSLTALIFMTIRNVSSSLGIDIPCKVGCEINTEDFYYLTSIQRASFFAADALLSRYT